MKDRFTLVFLTVLLAGLAILCFLVARPFLGPALVAAVLAIGFSAWHRKFQRWIPERTFAALLSTLLILLVTVLPMALVGVTIGGEISEHYEKLRALSDEEGGVAPYLHKELRRAAAWIAPRLQMDEEEVIHAVTERLKAATERVATTFAVGLVAVGTWMLNAVLAGLMLFFFLRDGPSILEFTVDLLPLRRDTSEHLVRVISRSIRANFHGVLGVALAQGTLTGLGLAIAGISSPFVWGVVAAFSSMLPFVGPALVWVPATVFLLAVSSYGMAVFLTVWGTVVIGLADNVLRPLLVGEQTDQHPMLVLFSTLGGMRAFGLLGLFLGPLLVSVTIAVLKVVRQRVSSGARPGPQDLLAPSATETISYTA